MASPLAATVTFPSFEGIGRIGNVSNAGSCTGGIICAIGKLGAIISALLPNVIILAGIIFFFLILFGGFKLIVGAGQNSSPQDAAKARAALTYGVIGFLLVGASYLILQIISDQLTGDQTLINTPAL